jgi:hypothetical protein
MVLKEKNQVITRELLQGLTGKIVHVPVNKLNMQVSEDTYEKIDVWFAGQVVGFDERYLLYDFDKKEFTTSPTVSYSLLLTDGMAYNLSAEECEILELSEEEFFALITKIQAEQALKEDILIAEEKKGLLLPGRDY